MDEVLEVGLERVPRPLTDATGAVVVAEAPQSPTPGQEGVSISTH
jgi:hypothetical protein